MRRIRRSLLPLALLTTVGLLAAACDRSPTAPAASSPSSTAAGGTTPTASGQRGGHGPAVDPSRVTGERKIGDVVIEPGYDAETGQLLFMLTPDRAPLPTHANGHAIAPLYLIAYPSNSDVAGSSDYHLSCEGVPGNCPDHDGLIAGIATRTQPGVYGSDSTAVPGHDHVWAAPGARQSDFNISWELIEVLFTPQGRDDGAIDDHLTTEAAIKAAVAAGDAQTIDLGVSVLCSVVSPSVYATATPVS